MKTFLKTLCLLPLTLAAAPAAQADGSGVLQEAPTYVLAQDDHLFMENMHIQAELLRMQATQEQIRVAQEKAQAYIQQLPKAKMAELKQKKIRYLAIPTVRSKDTPPSAKEVVMIWDIPRESLANKQVYQTDSEAPAGKMASFDDMQAEYIGTSRD